MKLNKVNEKKENSNKITRKICKHGNLKTGRINF